MKKVIIKSAVIALLTIASTQAMAWKIWRTESADGGGIKYLLDCDNGKHAMVIASIIDGVVTKYFALGGDTFKSFDDAARKSCNE
ncbi:hypothetical protein [uncultured Thiodictyon sp.]|uniref:hypothetical protein n=1 Tax=uncultured Thiodictyon sp. TaxID=1846217 RepID=UPI0025F6CD69|nr:hypothetical protein [uncultured Thiodictyon sp.]